MYYLQQSKKRSITYVKDFLIFKVQLKVKVVKCLRNSIFIEINLPCSDSIDSIMINKELKEVKNIKKIEIGFITKMNLIVNN